MKHDFAEGLGGQPQSEVEWEPKITGRDTRVETKPTVSVLMPTYNSKKYVDAAVSSVIKQTYTDWELIVVDDCSWDGTYELIERLALNDSRIRLLRHKVNSGAGLARTKALNNATGRFISYLDADDIWYPNKLERQLDFMLSNKIAFSCASYEVIDDLGKPLNKYVYMKPKVDYVGFLTNNLLQTVGIMADTNLMDKALLEMPPLKRRQDAATWLQVLKSGQVNYGMQEVLCQYRRTANSLSSNKLRAVQGVWSLYRKIERLPLMFSCYCFVRYAFVAVWKRVYLQRWLTRASGGIYQVK